MAGLRPGHFAFADLVRSAVRGAPGVTTSYHVIGLAIAVLIHVGILVHIKRRVRALSAA
jgi:hypothetical protein